MSDASRIACLRPSDVAVSINDRKIAHAFSSALSARASDLLDIACEAYATDRLVCRRLPGRRRDPYGEGWSRRLRVSVEVREPGFWSNANVTEALVDLLHWLTDDCWEFDFRPRHTPRRLAEVEGHLFGTPPPAGSAVGLFSGGLDAFAGSVSHLDASADGALVLVAAGTNFRQIATQARLMREIGRREGRIVPVIAPVHLIGAARHVQERTQRSRALLFLAVAAAVVEAAQLNHLLLFENGIGAINLPYDEGQVGAQTSRGAHPRTLRLATELMSLVLERELSISNPLFLFTKAQACRRLNERWHELIPSTVSCDTAFTDRRPGTALCGACTSCLLRRQALHAAGLAQVDRRDEYRVDLLSTSSEGATSRQLRAMRGQQAAIARALAETDPWGALVKRFPAIVRVSDELDRNDPLSHGREKLMNLFARYVEEWHAFPTSSDAAPAEDRLRSAAYLLPGAVS